MKFLFPVTTFLCQQLHVQEGILRDSAHLNVYINSFFPATAKIWNSLPATAIEARNTDDFKQRIVNYFCINPAIG